MAHVLALNDVSVHRSGTSILKDLTWAVDADERWVVLGRNGAGKSTLLQLAGTYLHPSEGEVSVLEETVGEVDVFELRPRIGFASSTLSSQLPVGETVLNAVVTAAYSVTGRWNEEYDELDIRRAKRVLAEWGLADLADRPFESLSDGEQKRVQIARSVMTDPELLLLDEPAASLDLGAREELITLLGGYARSSEAPAIVMVTHHVEEIPVGFTHGLLIADGEIVAAGPLDEAITSESLTETFGLPIELTTTEGRYFARAVRDER